MCVCTLFHEGPLALWHKRVRPHSLRRLLSSEAKFHFCQELFFYSILPTRSHSLILSVAHNWLSLQLARLCLTPVTEVTPKHLIIDLVSYRSKDREWPGSGWESQWNKKRINSLNFKWPLAGVRWLILPSGQFWSDQSDKIWLWSRFSPFRLFFKFGPTLASFVYFSL